MSNIKMEVKSEDKIPVDQKQSLIISGSVEEVVKEIQARDWEDEREHFSSKMYYLLAMLQICLSFHGIFGCSLACINHGGIYFFIPYTIFTIILGYPIHFLESSLGQYSQLGPIKVWNCVPLARGIGFSSIFLCVVIAFYNNMYSVYSVIYFGRIFDNLLPWSDCDRPSYKNRTCIPRQGSYDGEYYTPAQHYFYDHILQLDLTEHTGHYHLGGMIWQQVLVLVYSWFIVYLSLFQSIRSLERFLPIFVGSPLLCLILFLSLSIQLRGSFQAFKYIVDEKSFSHLRKISTWYSAVQQVLIELGLSQGTLIAYGSFAFHRNQTAVGSRRIVCANYIISLVSTIIIVFLLGSFSSSRSDSDVHPLHFKDYSYVFILFTECLGKLPGARLWCGLIFILICLSSLNSQICIMHTITCALYDQFPHLKDQRYTLNLGLCILFACSGILLCTTNSWILLQAFHEIPNMLSRIPIASFTVVAIILVYGTNKFCEDMHFLINYYPPFLLRICFYISPFLMMGVYLTNWFSNSTFSDSDFTILKCLFFYIVIWIPLGVFYWVIFLAVQGKLKGFWRSLEIWGPANEKARIARAFFSSESRVKLSMPWNKK